MKENNCQPRILNWSKFLLREIKSLKDTDTHWKKYEMCFQKKKTQRKEWGTKNKLSSDNDRKCWWI